VANGTYTLQSVAHYASGASGTSTGTTITVNNPPPTTVVLPSNGATLSGNQYLDATASGGVTQVQYELSGASLSQPEVIATATLTIYGWLAGWNTTTVANGTYTLQSVAHYASGASGTSTGTTITVNNPPPTTAGADRG
jgi:hypothetical protein